MGLKIVVQQQLTPIVVETDAHEIIGMFKTTTMHYTNIINNCRLLLLLPRHPIQHVYKEQNCVANSLAKHGATHVSENNCLLFANQPPFVEPFYQEDHAGTMHRRLVKTTTVVPIST